MIILRTLKELSRKNTLDLTYGQAHEILSNLPDIIDLIEGYETYMDRQKVCDMIQEEMEEDREARVSMTAARYKEIQEAKHRLEKAKASLHRLQHGWEFGCESP